MCQDGGVEQSPQRRRRPPWKLARSDWADAAGATFFRKQLRRNKVLEFAKQPTCMVAMEACAGAHHWAREIGKLGHTVRLIPPAYVKPFVKRQKNDAADSEAISEAAQWPTIRFVAVKSAEQAGQCGRVSGARTPGATAHPGSMLYAAILPSTA